TSEAPPLTSEISGFADGSLRAGSSWPSQGRLLLVVKMAHTVTAGELLDGHTVLDIECLDRVYLNAYVPTLQSSGQVVAFMTQHLGMPIPSPALMEQIGTRFRKAVESYAD